MADTFPRSKPFSEGAPLDPNDLNALRTDIATAYSQSALFNTTLNGQTKTYKYYFNCGQINFSASEISTTAVKYKEIDLGTGFDSTADPVIVTATIATVLGTSDNVSIFVDSSGNNSRIGLKSNTNKKDIAVNWTAIQQVLA